MTTSLSAQAPVADFKVCKKIIELYGTLSINDLSTNSPNDWVWDVLDSTGTNSMLVSGDAYSDPEGNGRNEFSKNPEFSFSIKGCFTIKLTSKNGSGSSTPKVKYCCVQVIDISDYYPGYGNYGPRQDNQIYSEYGEIYDNGGINTNYTNNQGYGTKSYLKITPSNGEKITIKFKQIKLADDTIFLYNADTVNNSKVLAKITSSSNGTYPLFTTSAAKMYFIFKSNGSNTDSGYRAIFYTIQDPSKPLNKQIIIDRNLVNKPSAFVNINKSLLVNNHTREWYVNDTLITNYTNKDTLFHTFYNTSSYKVCITISNCDTSYSNCIFSSNTTCEARFKVSIDTANTFSGIITDQSTASNSASYTWFFGDGDTSNSKTPTHVYPGMGRYYLCLKVIDGSCTSMYCDSIGFDASGNLTQVSTPFSIKIVDKNGRSSIKNEFISKLNIYPNPFTNILFIKNAAANINSITILNSLGKTIYHNTNILNENEIDLGKFTNGLYILQIVDVAGNNGCFKIIKN